MERLVDLVTRDRSPEGKLGRLPLNHYQYPHGSFREVERMGLRLRLDLSDLVDWAIYCGLVEPGLELFFREVRAGQSVIDVGANNGFVGMRLAQCVGPRGRVLSFEPHPDNFRRLTNNMGLNELPQMAAFPIGFGETCGRAAMAIVDPFNLGMHRVVPDRSEIQSVSSMKLTTLDSVCEEQVLTRLDWVKLDVEGYELKVLRGGRETLRALRPRLFIEMDDALLSNQGDSTSALLAELDMLGYTMANAATGAPVTPSESGVPAHFDALCTPK